MATIRDIASNLDTKKDFQNLMLAILNPLKPHYSEQGARLQLGRTMAHYDIGSTWMEAFSRPLWALVPFWAGGGSEPWFEDIYRRGLAAGTNPDGPEYWGECSPFNQKFVEMAAIACGIMFAPEKVWEPLTDAEKDNLVQYLNKINEHPLPVCNWIFFAILVNIAMKQKGRKYSPELLEQYLDGIDSFYIGDGWYRDGDSNQKDYYISFAIHYYSLIYAKVMADEDPERANKYKERACIFAQQFIYWFDDSGEAIPFGRSLTYRFAQVSFFSACLIAGVEPFSVGVMKGLIARHLKSWMEKPIFDRDDILTIGYGYPNLTMAERYNAPGSPYWSMKTFAFLMLPNEHPFWSVKAEPLPDMKPECPMPCADMFVYHYGNHTTAFAPGVYSRFGHGQIVAKYSKFAYDTRFSISIAKSSYELHENAPDSMLAFWINDYVYVRRICEDSKISQEGVWSKWSPYPGIEVETTVIPGPNGHKRIHKITSDIECEAYDCGFSIDRGDYTEVDFYSKAEGNFCEAGNNTTKCKISGESDSMPSEGYLITADPNMNLLYTKTAIPCVKYSIKRGQQMLTTEVEVEVK